MHPLRTIVPVLLALLVLAACGPDEACTVPTHWSLTEEQQQAQLSDGSAPAKTILITNSGPNSVRILVQKGENEEGWLLAPACSSGVGFQKDSSISVVRVDGDAAGTFEIVR